VSSVAYCANVPNRKARDAPFSTGQLPVEVTSFVGRRAELARAKRLLNSDSTRLLTLTGIGGVGKTRLALRLAHDLRRRFPGGVYLISLASLNEPDLVLRPLAEALGLMPLRAPLDAVINALDGHRVLLVLDNCEHLVEAVGVVVGTLLRALPELRIIATSRTVLNVHGEYLFAVPPLTAPPVGGAVRGGTDSVLVARYEAIQLLIDRAQAVGVTVTDDLWPGLVALCQRLDGIPLAIELAAARLTSLTVPDVLDRLDDRFRLLTGGDPRVVPNHHQTLRAAVHWSYQLCSPAEQLLWMRLSVFAGGFDLAAAETICAGDGIAAADVLDLLHGLVGQSIVTVERGAHRARYHLIETLRQFGQDQLDEDPRVAEELRRGHRSYYQALVREVAATWFGPREVELLELLGRELPNIRLAAHVDGRPGDHAVTLGTVVALVRTRYWFFSCGLEEGRLWLRWAADLPDQDPDSEQHLVALACGAWIALCQGDQDVADEFRARYQALAHRYREGLGAAAVDFAEGVRSLLVEARADALDLLVRARDRFAALGALGDAYMAAFFAATTAGFLTDAATARPLSDRLVADALAHEAAWAISWAWWCAALVEFRFGDHSTAGKLLRDALASQEHIGDHWGPMWTVEALAWLAAATGETEYAAQLFGAADQLSAINGTVRLFSWVAPFAALRSDAEHRVRTRMTPVTFTAAYDRGHRLDRGGIIRLALRGRPRRSHRTTITVPADVPLSSRELQVARALGEDLTNSAIGRKLSISERTVETHVRNILTKLGVANRHEIALWVRALDQDPS
jgi:predicted ATPase/DNA-binding CsgD family transcriptional regulator